MTTLQPQIEPELSVPGAEGAPPGPIIPGASARSFFRHVAETYLSRLALIAIGLVTSVVVARSLGPEGRGHFAVAVAIGALGIQFANLGLYASNTFAVSRHPRELPRLLGNSFMVSAVVGGLSAMTAIAFFLLWPGHAPLAPPLLWLAFAWIPFGLAYLLAQGLLLGLQRVRMYNATELAQRGAALILFVAIALSGRATAGAMFGAGALVLIATLAWVSWKMIQSCNDPVRPSLHLFKQDIQYGLRAYFTLLLGAVVLRCGLFVVEYKLGATEAGYYSVATAIAENVGILPAVVGSILFPTLCASPDIRAKYAFTKRVVLLTFLCTLPLLVGIGLVAKPVIAMLFGARFQDAAVPLVYLLPGVLFMGLNAVLVQFLNSIDYPIQIVWIWVATCALCVGGTIWAVPRLGFEGAAAAYSVACFALLLQTSVLTVSRARRYIAQAGQ